MTGWSFFFILVGVAFLTYQLFRIIDARTPALPPARHGPLSPMLWMSWKS